MSTALTPALPGAFDLLLRGQRELDEALETESLHLPVIARLLFIAVLGLGAHGFVVGLSAQLFGLSGIGLGELLQGPAALWLPIATVAAFLGALSICLPSFYFYTQLAGLDASFRIVTAQALRTQAVTSIYLLGALPIYLALSLTSVVTGWVSPTGVLVVGMVMPFLIGLSGLRSLFGGFRHMLTWVDITHERRSGFLLRLLGLWAAVYTLVAPVAFVRAAELLGGAF